MNVENYDVIVIGSGFGGSFAAYALANAGFKTLLLEKGGKVKRDSADWNALKILVDKRYGSASPLLIRQNGSRGYDQVRDNEALGGNSIFYGGASLRMRETDFEAWPIGYGDLEPYYSLAECLLEVHGDIGPDPCDPFRSRRELLPSIPLTAPAQRIYRAACELGYQPFKIPMAINFRNGSRPTCILCDTCDGFPCKIRAKNDLAMTVLKQAQEFNLDIMSGVIAERLIEEDGRITAVACIDKVTNQRFYASSRIVIVSGGAVQSPALLLRSDLGQYDHHRFIGRYLMRHCNAVVSSIFPYKTNPEHVFHKQVCISAFYEDMREQLGTSTGVIQDIYTPPREAIEYFAPWGLKHLAGAVSAYMQNMLVIAEDEPQITNGVSLAKERDQFGLPRLKVEHHYGRDDYYRRDYLVGKAKKVLRKSGALAHYVYEIDTLSHAVGTVRFGDSPETSVLDKNCRFFGIDNLFVLDGSFMPSPAGVNPSLTIAANSLRVAQHIIASSGVYRDEKDHLHHRLWENRPAPRKEPVRVL